MAKHQPRYDPFWKASAELDESVGMQCLVPVDVVLEKVYAQRPFLIERFDSLLAANMHTISLLRGIISHGISIIPF